MKRILMVVLGLLLIPSLLFAQSGLINPNQIQQQVVNCVAGENLTSGDVVSLINSGSSVTAKKNNLVASTSPNGAESVFKSAGITYCSAAALDATRFVVGYRRDSYACCIVGTVSGSTISWGTEKVSVAERAVSYVSVVLLSSNTFLMVGSSSAMFAGENRGIYEVFTVSGSIIASVTSGYSTTNPCTYNTAITIDTNKAIMCFYDTTASEAKARTITFNGSAATLGTEYTFNAAATAYISVSALDSGNALVCYADGGNSNYGTAQVLSISGTTITPGTESVFSSAASTYVKCCALSSTKAIVACRDTAATKGRVRVANITTNIDSWGTLVETPQVLEEIGEFCKISSTQLVLPFNDSAANIGKTSLITVSGDLPTVNTGIEFNNAYVTAVSGVYIGNQKSVIVYNDYYTSQYGTAVVNSWATPSYAEIRGLATTTTSSGGTVPVLLHGTLSAYSGLTSGADYFVTDTMEISTVPVLLNGSYIKIGEAINSTTIFCH